MVFKKLAQSLKWLYVYVLNYVKTQFWLSAEDKVPGPFALPIFGSLWLYTWMGPYSHDRYYYLVKYEFVKQFLEDGCTFCQF